MAKLYFKYGSGKSADLCQTAYNYNENGMNVVIINALNDEDIVSKYYQNGRMPLQRKINLKLSEGNLFDQIYFRSIKEKLSCILIDNSQYLTDEQAEDLFFVANLLNIPVIAYGDRMLPGNVYSAGAMRLMELSNVIEEIDREYLKGNRKTKGAELEFYYGAMNSSKTAKLLYKASELEDAGLNVFLMKPSKDRDATKITSRIGMQREADFLIDESTKIYGEGEYLQRDHINYILVDEAQFLSVRQINELKQIVNDYNIPIRCYGLKVDFLSHHFTGSGRLLEASDSLVKLRTVCHCGHGAIFNARVNSNGEYQKEGEVVCIDNGANYISVCPECFIKEVMDDRIPKVLKKVK